MKKFIMACTIVLCALPTIAQTVADGVSFSLSDDYGTARFRSLSGAFGALGGDLSAIGVNPAGSVIFANHYASFSLANDNNRNNSIFNGNSNTTNDNDLSINQLGLVLVYENNDSEATINKFSFGLNFDNTNNLDNQYVLRGTNNTSIGDYFTSFANGEALIDLALAPGETVDGVFRFLGENGGFSSQQAFLGFQSFIIDPVDPNDDLNTQYISNTGTGSFNQSQLVTTNGSISKFSFNGAMQLNNKLSLGVNLNVHNINQNRLSQFDEVNSNGASVTAVQFDNDLQIDGSGISLQAGAIYNLGENLRLGATYKSPTWYRIEESLIQSVSATLDDGSREIIAPDVITLFSPYDLRTPGSITGSLAYIFGKRGLISVDYESIDYTQMQFRPANDPFFANNNTEISNTLQRAAVLRIGGEFKVKQWSLRAGYRMEESPYSDQNIMSDLNGYSLGLGYRWGSTTLDIAYNKSERTFQRRLFDSSLTSTGQIDNTQNNITATLGFNF